MPEVLLSGHHERMAQWRRERSRERAAAQARESGTESAATEGEVGRDRGAVRYHLALAPLRGPPGPYLVKGAPLLMSSVIETIERAQFRRVPRSRPATASRCTSR